MISPFDLPPNLQAKVEEELEAGERIQWLGMPTPRFLPRPRPPSSCSPYPGRRLRSSGRQARVRARGAWRRGDGPGFFCVFPLFGLPFLFIGIGMLSAPLWAYRAARKTAYMVTDRRAVTFDGGWSTTIRSYAPAKLQDVYRREKEDGSGNVIDTHAAFGVTPRAVTAPRSLGSCASPNPKEVGTSQELAAPTGTAPVQTPPEGSR